MSEAKSKDLLSAAVRERQGSRRSDKVGGMPVETLATGGKGSSSRRMV